MASELKNLLVNRIVERALADAASQHLRGDLADIGCGTKPYRELVAPHVSRHVGFDHPGTRHARDSIDAFATAYALPVAEGSFDSAICTAVLEHLEEPEQALRECHRILSPGGAAIYTVPFIWHVHEEPRDFFRYSPYGLEYLFHKVGFDVLEVRPLSGFWVTFGQLFVYNLYRLNKGQLRWLRIIDALGLICQVIAWLFDKFDRTERWSWAHLVIARKPDQPATST